MVGKITDNGGSTYGFNAQTEEYVDMIQAGIVDPAKVVRTALQDAASVAGLLVTTEAMVADAPKKDSGCPRDAGRRRHGRHGLLSPSHFAGRGKGVAERRPLFLCALPWRHRPLRCPSTLPAITRVRARQGAHGDRRRSPAAKHDRSGRHPCRTVRRDRPPKSRIAVTFH